MKSASSTGGAKKLEAFPNDQKHSGGRLGAIRRLASKSPIKKLIAEHFPDVDPADELEMQSFILAIDALAQTLNDFEEGPDAEYFSDSVEWCNENEAALGFERVCGQLRMNERQARKAIAAMFPGFQAVAHFALASPRRRRAARATQSTSSTHARQNGA